MKAEKIVDNMFTDVDSYKEFMEDMLIKQLNSNQELKDSWAKWFRGEQMD